MNLASAGVPVAFVTDPRGGGNHDINIIWDGVKPSAGSTDYSKQYDTYVDGGGRANDWFGYTFYTQHTFTSVVFQEGGEFFDGGWFTSIKVQVRQSGTWNDVTSQSISPSYPNAPNSSGFDTYTFTFAPMTGDGIRVYGVPGGTAHFTSVAELEVYGDNPNVALFGTPTALVTSPTGTGNHNINIIADGMKPAVGSTDNTKSYDTYDGGGARANDWIGYTFPISYTFTDLVFQEGIEGATGGWFTSLTVHVRQSGTWNTVSGLSVSPTYPNAANSSNFDTYVMTFTPITGDGIRIYGPPGGSAHFTSTAEMQVFAQPTAIDGAAPVSVSGSAAIKEAVAFTGTGQSSVSGSATITSSSGNTAIDGVGASSASGSAAVSEAVAFTGSGQSSVSGTATVSVAAAFVGTGASSVSGSALESVDTSLVGTGQVSVAGAAAQSEAVALVGTGASSVSASSAVSPAVALTGSGDTSSTGTAAVSEAAGLVGTGAVSVSGVTALSEAVALTGTGQVSVSASATQGGGGSTAIDGSGNVSVSATGALSEAAALTGSGQTAVAGSASLSDGTALQGTGQAQTAGAAAVSSSAAITGRGDVSVSGAGLLSQGLAIDGAGNVSVAATAAMVAQLAATGAGNVACAASGTITVTAALTGSGQVAVQGTGTFTGFAAPTSTAGLLNQWGRRWLESLGRRGVRR